MRTGDGDERLRVGAVKAFVDGGFGAYVVMAIIGSVLFYVLVILAAGMAGPWRVSWASRFSGVVTFLAALLGRGAILAFVDVGSFCIALAFLGVALSLIRLRRRFPDLERPYRMRGVPFLAYVATAGSLLIMGVMLFPGSPSMLVWPLEWAILSALSATGVAFWVGARPYRQRVSEGERARLILEDHAG